MAKKLTKRQKEFIEIFKKNMCLITKSCDKAQVPLRTYYNWLDDPTFRDAVEEARTSIKDFGEAALFKLINSGNPAATIFYNKTKNRDRGYIERREIEHSGGATLNLTPDEIKEEVKRLLK